MRSLSFYASNILSVIIFNRFRHHSTDLNFLESMHRWATNAQVLIKSEASFSNGMAAEVGSHLATLRRRVDACERPNIDKEVTSNGVSFLIYGLVLKTTSKSWISSIFT